MCGIFGAYNKQGTQSQNELLLSALNTIKHRGPDSFGTWRNPDQTIFLAHRRLAIIDLSPAGHQPMISPSGRYTITFNGEVYNFQEIRKELEAAGQAISANGDTAIMLAAFDAWGVQAAINKFVGMFAFGVWDAEQKQLILARDRIGEKPLYYGWIDNNFFFSSELDPIIKASTKKFKINRTALGHLLRFGYIPSPISIFEDVFKLPAASSLTLDVKDLNSRPQNFDCYAEGLGLTPKKYWNLSNFLLPSEPNTKSETQLVEELDQLLKQAVGQQMISDVPLGAFLSGGIDSSTIVAIMQTLSNRPVRTFSIGFEKKSHDEAPYAKAVAKHLGTEHTELYVSEKTALDTVPSLPDIYSEPFGDSSQLPTYLVSKLTRQSVTVSLSGDGADEIFGGYERFIWTKRLWNLMRWSPKLLRRGFATLANKIPTAALDSALGACNGILPETLRLKNAGSKIQRALSIGAVKSPEDLYLVLLGQKLDPAKVVLGFTPSRTDLASTQNWPETKDLYSKLMWMDVQTYLPDDIFVKVDRASMAVALESRAPFLDHRLVEFAFRLPTEMKIKAGTTKYLLKKLLEKYVPKTLTHRPKMGFGIPVGSWLAGELKDWAQELINPQALSQSAMFNEKIISETWKSHLKGNYSNQYFLWHVLMFQAWLKKYQTKIEY